MSKYSSFSRETVQPKPKGIHPIWRGIGFIFMIIAPIIAYFATILVLEENANQNWFTIPRDLIAKGADPNLYVKIIGTITIVFLLYALFMLFTFVIYRLFGPSRFGAHDAPQEAFRGRRHRR